MVFRNRDQETICAISTPSGYGGISVVRVSGAEAYQVVKAMSKSLPECPDSHRIYFTSIRDSFGSLIDEVLVSFFGHGKSFTGEEVVEISSHGNPLICESILSCLVDKGARLADRGEFTYRAFMNGRMDLIQAESVLSLIESQSVSSRALALRQLKGGLSGSIESIEDSLIWCLAHIEANIDFSSEGLETVSGAEIFVKMGEIESRLEGLVGTYRSGRIIQDGLRVALVGPPNVGKSSILNFVCEENRAIVTPIPGTTRDLVLGEVMQLGQKIVFVDTAGLREKSGDPVEILGIAKSPNEMHEADLVVYVFDLALGLTKSDLDELKKLNPDRLLILGNKKDLLEMGSETVESYPEELGQIEWTMRPSFLSMSVFNSGDRLRLLTCISEFAKKSQPEVGAIISHARHLEGLNKAFNSVREARSEYLNGVGAEFLALSLKESLLFVQQVLGKVYDDQVLDRVFKEFCLGK